MKTNDPRLTKFRNKLDDKIDMQLELGIDDYISLKAKVFMWISAIIISILLFPIKIIDLIIYSPKRAYDNIYFKVKHRK